ncbi:histidine/lysine/arginine/ornithine transporter subunit; membrane component of ABC superfamily [uncultured Alphaproteobacteria bacterium]|uniref:Histidine/lysine/arginine/ornithine transporter subunit membrane component of ABC superfamily n=1 Tax=uncultured Alphaproteobacteria bacterium TaxID=91750 RepID=A0A212JAX9_9PROT|nr:histidine/lysine/arginine/ornithine transporter subunit; membrane component of ABC superfamily [uncultured Alphaproteobacteria bacterium]
MEDVIERLPEMLIGAVTTVELTLLALVVGIVIAVPAALARTSRHLAVRAVPYAYIFVFRGSPLLVQMFLLYYGLSQFQWIRDGALWPILRQPYWCAVIAFALNTGAYTAEILRGGIQSIPKGEIEAARACGMSPFLMTRRIVLPRAFRIAWPAYGNEVIFMLKGSALASTITLLDITGMARTIIAENYLALEFFGLAGVLYLLISWAFMRVLRAVEIRLNGHLRPPSEAHRTAA